MNFELDDYRFRQADVLRLVPGLSQGTLQNWIARGLLRFNEPKPHKHAKTSWCAYNIVSLGFVVQVTKLGFKPSEALDLCGQLEAELDEFMTRFTPTLDSETGVEKFVLGAGADFAEYRAMMITRNSDGAPRISRLDPERGTQLLAGLFAGAIAYITFESDRHFAKSLNMISLYIAGRDPHAGELMQGGAK
nr:hypothetical protein [uncultured Sphaerochaeta sp.]